MDDRPVFILMHWLTRNVAKMSEHQQQRRPWLLEHSGPPLDRFFTDAELEQWASHWRQPIDALSSQGTRFEHLGRSRLRPCRW